MWKFIKKNIGEIKEGKAADLAIINTEESIFLTASNMLSKSKNTPFINKNLKGKVVITLCNGRITWSA